MSQNSRKIQRET